MDEVSEESSIQRQSLEAKGSELVECQLRLGITENKLDSWQKTLIAAEDKIVALRDDYLFAGRRRRIGKEVDNYAQ